MKTGEIIKWLKGFQRLDVGVDYETVNKKDNVFQPLDELLIYT